ncbi:glutamic acid-rich protein isoform X1 [Morus notabilis]|uniref:glutamic acid-rich protein isoform X1 n=1 Tax=Morus notabilis TaxID=981085 RepID=UPI000CED7354|nr:glutamic acid-rich protein isoform X1 [Morus notabilis]XP_024022540.1 glutamic acid-rich protein isoform X1 [Morus notabilis]
MAYRGRGRGRGFRGGGGGIGYAKQEPFVYFPDVELPDIKGVTVEEMLVRRSQKLLNYWKASPYYLEATISKIFHLVSEGQNAEIEKVSDRNKVGTTIKRDSLSQILVHKSFPVELTEGSKGWQSQPGRKRVRWNPDSELQKLDIFEKLEQRQAQNGRGEKEKKEGENEDEDEDEENEETEEEPSDDDDYNQNVDFDDDEDDFNADVDGEDEMTY